jgi:hypothetical protein
LRDFVSGAAELASLKHSSGVFEMVPEPHSLLLEPADLKLLGSAFDEAWACGAPDIAIVDDVAGARAQLASIMLELAKLRQLDGDELKNTAVRLFKTRRSPPSEPAYTTPDR